MIKWKASGMQTAFKYVSAWNAVIIAAHNVWAKE